MVDGGEEEDDQGKFKARIWGIRIGIPHSRAGGSRLLHRGTFYITVERSVMEARAISNKLSRLDVGKTRPDERQAKGRG